MKTPVVLVGIVTRNRAAILPKAITSVAVQNYPSLQITVIDNGSTDGTPLLAERFPKVTWTRWQSNRGHMTARNHLMDTETASYFVSLDDDAWFIEDNEISLAVDYLERYSKVAAVAFDILSTDQPQPVSRLKPIPVAMFIGCGHMVRIDAIRQVGGYEIFPGSYGSEEKDLCLRLLDAGYEIAKLPGVHVWHDKTPVARNITARHRSAVCNDLVMALRRTPLPLLPIALPAKVYAHSRVALKHGLLWPCLQGMFLFLRSIPTVLRTRGPVTVDTLRTFIRLSRI